ncbi:MFS transporter [Candidatus Bathyarchaeota archaeon]|nr:MFS transporter [Candidatus Bathyarchaeota archaeon]
MEKKNIRIFWAIFFATFFAMFGDTIPQSFQPQFISQLGVSAAIITLIYNIRNVIQTILRLVSGTISDSLGRRNMMLFGLALFAIVPFLYSVATNPWLPIIAMTASGLALSIFFPPSEAYASSLFPPEKTGEAMGRYHMSWAVSSVIGPSIGGYLASHFLDYKTIYVFSGVLTCIGFFIAWRYTVDDRAVSCPIPPGILIRQTFSELPSTVKRLLSNKRVLIACFAVFAHSFCHWGLITFIPLLGAEMGMSEFWIGITLTANALLIAISLPIIGPLSDRIGRFIPIITGLLVSVFAFAYIPMIPKNWMFPLLNAILGICAVLVFPVSQAATMQALPPKDRGSATGVWGMVMSLGGSLGMFVMSAVLSVTTIQWVFYANAAFTLGSALVIIMMRKYFD